MNSSELLSIILKAVEGEKYALAKLISEIEREDSLKSRKLIFQELAQLPPKNSVTIGITGTPGAGKSSLIGEICRDFLDRDIAQKIAILAIDPSSAISGGSILGDRTRVFIPPRNSKLFFRSQPSQLELGGINPHTYHVTRLLRYLFEYVIIETVGIGQNEIEVSKISDFSFLVMQPLGGDQIQFMKSGIMEVPDAFIINKCDEEKLALSSYYTLIASLEFLKDTIHLDQLPPVFLTSVLNRKGTFDLTSFILKLKSKNKHLEKKHQIEKWIRTEYGKHGLKKVQSLFSQIDLNQTSFEEVEEMVTNYLTSLT